MNLGPLDIASDLKVWLDASDLTSVPNPWVDKSGSGNSPEKKGSGHTITTAAQNGLNVLTFNTANQDFYEKTSSTITDDDQTWLFLVKPLSSQTLNGNASAIFALGGGSYTLRFSSGNTGYYRGRALVTGPSGWHLNSLWLTHTAGGSSTNKGGVWNLIGLHRIGSTIQLYMNGTTVNSGTASSYALGSDTYFRIMSGSSNYNVRGDLAEVVAFQSKNDTTREKLEGYLAHKWGLTSLLPSGHTYKTDSQTYTAWSDVQSFTTPTNISAPVLGAQSVANLDTTSADLEVVLSDNGNDATTITFYYGTYRWGNHSRFLGFQSLLQQCLGGHHPCICNRADQRADLLLPCLSQKQLQPKQRGGLGQFIHCLHHRDQFDPRRDRSGALLRPGRLVETGRQPQRFFRKQPPRHPTHHSDIQPLAGCGGYQLQTAYN